MADIQTQLADRIIKAGAAKTAKAIDMDRSTLNRIVVALEQGRGTTSIETIERLALHFGLRATLVRASR